MKISTRESEEGRWAYIALPTASALLVENN
jgi:hypothetical protein